MDRRGVRACPQTDRILTPIGRVRRSGEGILAAKCHESVMKISKTDILLSQRVRESNPLRPRARRAFRSRCASHRKRESRHIRKSSFNDCGELGIKRGLTQRGVMKSARGSVTASPHRGCPRSRLTNSSFETRDAAARRDKKLNHDSFEVARLLVCLDQAARAVVNANHDIARERLRNFA